MPAFVGLGAPYWNPRVRGALFGLTRNTGPAELAQCGAGKRLLPDARFVDGDARRLAGGAAATTVLRVDGGMTASDWTMQRLADLLDAPVDRPMIQETTALGAAYLAGLAAGIFPEPSKLRRQLAARTPLQTQYEPSHKGTEIGRLGPRSKGPARERRGGGVSLRHSGMRRLAQARNP